MQVYKEYYKTAADSLTRAVKKRNMNCLYYETAEEAVRKIIRQLNEGATVSWGGSQTLEESGMLAALKKDRFIVYDRAQAQSPAEAEELYHKALTVDYYFLSTNAITRDGKLVNIDGRGNRLAALIYGPKHVFVIAGMNKICSDEASALARIRNYASPLNVQRLGKKTPCAKTGFCEDCQSDDCICCQTVITRRSSVGGRITVVLIGETLGY
ncbi:MAG: lactate utilization protein [Spirochaetales bacterium]|nr:lactate utilization protein [Spirochaetales bacterium]